MRLLLASILLQVVVTRAQWAAITSQEASNSCNDGETRPFGSCSPRFVRCRCNQWIAAVCPGTSIFDEQTELCIFSSGCGTTTPSPVYPVTTPGYGPSPSPSNNGYPTQAPAYPAPETPSSYPTAAPSSYPTAAPSSYSTAAPSSYSTAAPSSYSTAVPSSYPTAALSSYPTATPITVGYLTPEPVTAGYPTQEPITAGYPSAVPITAGYLTPEPITAGYPTQEPITAGYPTLEPITVGYTTTGSPIAPPDYVATSSPVQEATISYPQEVPVTSVYSNEGTPGPVANSPVYPTASSSSYQANSAVAYGVHVPTELSNPFFVEKRHGRYNRYRHRSSQDEENNMRKLPARSRSLRVDSRSHYVPDVYRAHDSRKMLSSSWDVFPRSRVHRKWAEKRRKLDDEFDEDPEMRAATRTVEQENVDTPLTESIPIEDGSGIVPEELQTRRKRSYNAQETLNIRCQGAADNSIFSMGFCAQNFVVCKSSEEIMAACPVGDLFDFGVARCVPASVCGVSNANICVADISTSTPVTTTTATPYTLPVNSVTVPSTSYAYPTQGYNSNTVPSTSYAYPTQGYNSNTVPSTSYAYPTQGYNSSPSPSAYPMIGYPTQAPAYPSHETSSSSGYSTADPTTAGYVTPEPVTAGYPTAEATTTASPVYSVTTPTPSVTYAYPTPGYNPSLSPSTNGYPAQAPAYPTEEAPRQFGYPSAEPINAGYLSPEPAAEEHPTSEPVTAEQNTASTPLTYFSVKHTTTEGAIDSTTEAKVSTESTQAPFVPYGVVEEEVATKASPPRVIYLSVSSNRSEFCVGREDALYRDPQACAGIIQCHGGEMFQHNSCASGLVFNERKQQCDYKNQVPECDRPDQDPSTDSGCKGAQHGAYLPDEKDCKVFYRCVWNRLARMNCPAGTFFNPTLSVCDWPANVKCAAELSADQPKSSY